MPKDTRSKFSLPLHRRKPWLNITIGLGFVRPLGLKHKQTQTSSVGILLCSSEHTGISPPNKDNFTVKTLQTIQGNNLLRGGIGRCD